MKLIYIVPIILLILGGFTFFFLFTEQASFHSPETETNVPLTGEVKEFQIEAFQFGFDPAVIEVNRGDVVKITAWSRDVEHGFMISEYNINIRLTEEPQTIEFVADRQGTFSFFCHVPCGKGHSAMRGTFIVY